MFEISNSEIKAALIGSYRKVDLRFRGHPQDLLQCKLDETRVRISSVKKITIANTC